MSLGAPRLLPVEDGPQIRRALTRALQAAGYAVETAKRGTSMRRSGAAAPAVKR